MNKKQIRYLCSRIRTEAEGFAEKPELPQGFMETFESQANFRGWMGFGVTWDVDPKDPWKIVLREKSIEDEWNGILEKVVPEFPVAKRDVVKKRGKKHTGKGG